MKKIYLALRLPAVLPEEIFNYQKKRWGGGQPVDTRQINSKLEKPAPATGSEGVLEPRLSAGQEGAEGKISETPLA
jgi:hypothetical protein